jgi:multiple sugar transport system substrate-binding protein
VSSRATTGAGRRRRVAVVVAVGATVLSLAACQAEGDPPPEPAPSQSSSTADPVELTLGVQGAQDELAAYEAVSENFDSLYDLATLQEERLIQPVDVLLDERGVDFGDGYSRDALQAFSAEDRLQCMPYGISPMVIYYNTKLVDFDRIEARGLPVPAEREAWTLDMFAAAAQIASRPGRRTHGFYIEPGLRTLAPFVYSGGGELFDDEDAPTSLALAEGDGPEALERALELLRRPQLTLSEQQVERRSPLEWFERGKLGMMAGYRRLVPELRQVHGLDFDVISMPILDSAATTGDITGLPVGRRRQHPGRCRPDGPPAQHPRCGPGGARRLPRARQQRGRTLRRVPPARPAAGALLGVQQQRPGDPDPAAALGVAGAGG